MQMRVLIGGSLACVLALAGCGRQEAELPTVFASMTEVVMPEAQVLWDVSINAMDDEGEPDASGLSDADWARIAESGRKLKEASLLLTDARRLRVVEPGQTIQDEGAEDASSAAQVQGYIDQQPDAFAAFARAMAAASDEFITSANNKDAALLLDVSGRLDQVCEACHVQFWYPQLRTAN